MKNKQTQPRKIRLHQAKHWITTYEGKNLVKGYKKRFKVSILDAIRDLQLIGYPFSEEYINSVNKSEEARIRQRQERKKKRQIEEDFPSNEYFYYIAGYTENGVAFGITWEEALEEGLIEQEDLVINEHDLPF